MPFSEKTQRLRHLKNGFSESARNSELETIFKPFELRHVIKSGSSHSLYRPSHYTLKQEYAPTSYMYEPQLI